MQTGRRSPLHKITFLALAMLCVCGVAEAGMARSSLSVRCVVTRSDENTAALSVKSFATPQAAAIGGASPTARRKWAVDPAVISAGQRICRLRAERIGVPVSSIADVRWFVARDGLVYRALVCR